MSSVDEKSSLVTQALKYNLLIMRLELFSNLINHYSYCLEKGSWKLFQNAQKNRVSHEELQSHLILLLENCLEKIKSKTLAPIFKQLQKGLRENGQLFLRLEEGDVQGRECKAIYEDYKQINTAQTEQLKQLHSTLNTALQAKLSKLKKTLGASFVEAMRLQRSVLLYQRWKEYLLRFQEELPEDALTRGANQQTKTALMRCVTYTKKSFFKDFLSPEQEGMRSMALAVDMAVHDFPLADEKARLLIDTLRLRNEALAAEVDQQEKQLQKNISLCERVLIRLLLAVMQQPDFQFGDQGFDMVIQQMDKFPELPAVGEKLDPRCKTFSQKAVACLCLVGGLWGASLIGYGYHLIAAFNRVMDADITLQLKIGKYFFGSDPIDVIEKDHILQWLMGLGLSLGIAVVSELFVSESVLAITLTAVTLAYMAATLSARVANGFLDYLGAKMHFKAETLSAIKLIVHIMAYSLTYQKTFETTHFSLIRLNEKMKARAILGCGFMDSRETISQQFRALGFQNHPDRCKTAECAITMQEITRAYALLKF